MPTSIEPLHFLMKQTGIHYFTPVMLMYAGPIGKLYFWRSCWNVFLNVLYAQDGTYPGSPSLSHKLSDTAMLCTMHKRGLRTSQLTRKIEPPEIESQQCYVSVKPNTSANSSLKILKSFGSLSDCSINKNALFPHYSPIGWKSQTTRKKPLSQILSSTIALTSLLHFWTPLRVFWPLIALQVFYAAKLRSMTSLLVSILPSLLAQMGFR